MLARLVDCLTRIASFSLGTANVSAVLHLAELPLIALHNSLRFSTEIADVATLAANINGFPAVCDRLDSYAC